jgi:cellobionic acid phosphorylase
MLLQVNCRGYVVAQHMQPEPAKYSHAPILEQPTFMLPEAPLYAHHPGRFFYVRDRETGDLFSLPYEPVRVDPDSFTFSVGRSDIEWRVKNGGIVARVSVSLPVDDVVELWELELRNPLDRVRRLDVVACFSIGYMSWMNQSARYRADLGAIVASSVSPYQKLEDYARVAALKDQTYLLHDTNPYAWEASRAAFEGEGGLPAPSALQDDGLRNGEANFEVPVAALQYRVTLEAGERSRLRFLFGPARLDDEILDIRERYFANGEFELAGMRRDDFMARGRGCLEVNAPDPAFENFVNAWLGRQVYYHGSANRMTTDPQTRNYLQDGLGMVYVDPAVTREVLLTALGQQHPDGAMPDGVVLSAGAELKYINQVPHTDHCVWVPVCLAAYLDETGDIAFLDRTVPGGGRNATVLERVTAAMRWLLGNRDTRGLSLIGQGDWCDPMNMAGHKGRGVSGWLSIAVIHALQLWVGICRDRAVGIADEMAAGAAEITAAVQQHFWDGDWFARGISDDGTIFGVRDDDEGRMYLNPQSWALMAGVASSDQVARIISAVDQHLETPFGPMVLAPAYTYMRENIGRLTQKYPGVAENGSVYSHAVAFYIYALFQQGESDRAYDLIMRLLPGPDDEDSLRRGQLPVFVPNYYRGAMHQFPRTAGRSSQLFNTGAASWLYRSIVEGLFGLRGSPSGLVVDPRLPSAWSEATARRRFRGASYIVRYRREPDATAIRVAVDGRPIAEPCLPGGDGKTFEVDVVLPTS